MDGGGGGGFRPNRPYALNRLVSRAHDGSGEGALVHGLKWKTTSGLPWFEWKDRHPELVRFPEVLAGLIDQGSFRSVVCTVIPGQLLKCLYDTRRPLPEERVSVLFLGSRFSIRYGAFHGPNVLTY